MLVFLTGFMCAGKTTIGKAAADILEVPFLDLDEEFEKRSGRSISDFIESLGISEFRRLETVILSDTGHHLQQALSHIDSHTSRPGAIIATGGGCVLMPENRAYLNQDGHSVVWLNTPFQEIYERIRTNPRPLLKDLSEADIHAMYQERIPLYQITAKHTLSGTDPVNELIALFQ